MPAPLMSIFPLTTMKRDHWQGIMQKKKAPAWRVAVTLLALTAAVLLIPGCQTFGGGKALTTRYFLYAANTYGNSVSAYSINSSSGELTAVSGSPFTAGTRPEAVAIAAVTGP